MQQPLPINSVVSCAQASFGPFYRIEQLILTSARASGADERTQSGRTPIVTDANIQLLFDMQVGHKDTYHICFTESHQSRRVSSRFAFAASCKQQTRASSVAVIHRAHVSTVACVVC